MGKTACALVLIRGRMQVWKTPTMTFRCTYEVDMTKYVDQLQVKTGEREGSEITLRILAQTTGWIGASIIEIGTVKMIG